MVREGVRICLRGRVNARERERKRGRAGARALIKDYAWAGKEVGDITLRSSGFCCRCWRHGTSCTTIERLTKCALFMPFLLSQPAHSCFAPTPTPSTTTTTT